MNVVVTLPAVATSTWNGPVCQTCHRGYIGAHTCSVEDLTRMVDELTKLIDQISPSHANIVASRCPCDPATGGSGICGCVHSGTQIIC